MFAFNIIHGTCFCWRKFGTQIIFKFVCEAKSTCYRAQLKHRSAIATIVWPFPRERFTIRLGSLSGTGLRDVSGPGEPLN